MVDDNLIEASGSTDTFVGATLLGSFNDVWSDEGASTKEDAGMDFTSFTVEGNFLSTAMLLFTCEELDVSFEGREKPNENAGVGFEILGPEKVETREGEKELIFLNAPSGLVVEGAWLEDEVP